MSKDVTAFSKYQEKSPPTILKWLEKKNTAHREMINRWSRGLGMFLEVFSKLFCKSD